MFSRMPIHEVAYWNAMVGEHAMYMLRILLIILNRYPNKGFKMNVVTSGALLSNCSHRNLVQESLHLSEFPDLQYLCNIEAFFIHSNLLGGHGFLSTAGDSIVCNNVL